MTDYQHNQCARIIKDAADAALISGGIFPGGAKPFQVKMVMELADVFDVSMNTSRAASIVKNYFTAGGTVFGVVSSIFLTATRAIPGAGQVINGFRAAEETEDFGWKVARDFDNG